MSHYIDKNKYWKSSWMHPISHFTINNISLISSVTDRWSKKKSTLYFMVWVIHRTSVCVCECVCERRTSMQWVRLSVRSKRPVDRRLIPIVLGDPLRLRYCPFSCTCQWTRQCRCFPGWTGRPGVERSLCRLLAQVSCCLCPLVSALCVSAQAKRPLWRRSGKSLQGPLLMGVYLRRDFLLCHNSQELWSYSRCWSMWSSAVLFPSQPCMFKCTQ